MAVKKATKRTTTKAQAEKRSSEAVKRDNRRRQIWSVILFAMGILFIVFAFIGSTDTESPNAADLIHIALRGLFGISVFFIGPILIYISIMLSANKTRSTIKVKLIQLCIMVLLISAAMQILFVGNTGEEKGFFESIGFIYSEGVKLIGGGVAGLIFGVPLLLFGRVVAGIIIVLIVFVFVMLTANISLLDFLKAIGIPFKKLGGGIKAKQRQYREDSEILKLENERRYEEENIVNEAVRKKELELQDIELERARKFASIEAATSSGRNVKGNNSEIEEQISENESFTKELKSYITDETPSVLKTEYEDGPYSPDEDKSENNAVLEAIEAFKEEAVEENAQSIANENEIMASENIEAVEAAENIEIIEKIPSYAVLKEQYSLPPVVLLNDIIHEKSDEDIAAELENNSVTLVETLKSFGVQTKIVGVCRGPSVTRYELQPAAGVKISKITGLVDDIALNLATAGVRIEAPIPNKAAVGIEVPNKKVETVPFRSLVDSTTFNETDSKLGAVLGKDISGDIIIADIAKMPHLLIAGTTGSGKSVCVNSIIMSILFRSTPDEVRLLMIDPKAVEFMIYNGIPHLLIPVVTDPKKAAGALGWAVTEMLNRYKMFADNNVRDLNGYNSLSKGNPEIAPLPQIVIFIDELADLMMASPGEVEDSICRLAQMARAAGMHLVIATQRPSVNVVTGVIKANIPSRIALKVASQVDSRTIIDSAGAEKLLGKGDMLYFPVGMPKPTRVQGCWVSDKEVERVVEFIKNSFVLSYDESVIEEIERQAEIVSANDKSKSGGGNSLDLSDDKLEEAIEVVIEAGQASTSYLQRKLSLGYGRAAKLIDIMEEMGIVGEFKGGKPREILMTRQEWYERKINQD